MSCNYAENLSQYENKGKLGLPEKFDKADEVARKSDLLATMLRESKHTVVHTGAGVSTAAGIPDFRGPNGVWTLEKEGKKPSLSVEWLAAKPTLTHMALAQLIKAGYISYIVTQNIDGLHLRSGIERKYLSELHGNLFVDQCQKCCRQFVRGTAATTVGLKSEGVACESHRRCRGKLRDTILDWEDALPYKDLTLAELHSCVADLSLCLGTTLQIVPSGNLPVATKKRGGKLVICNLQPTKQDRQADLIINTYVDDVLRAVLRKLDLALPEYEASLDPIVQTRNGAQDEAFKRLEWTIDERAIKDKDLLAKARNRRVLKRPQAKAAIAHKKARKEEKDFKQPQSVDDKSEIELKNGTERTLSEDHFDTKIKEESDIKTNLKKKSNCNIKLEDESKLSITKVE